MGVDEKERERAILDATAQLLLEHGYNKLTMNDVADAVGLNRRLIYLLFPTKDALIGALLKREMNSYIEEWDRYLDRDPLGGSVASVYRSLLVEMKRRPLLASRESWITRRRHATSRWRRSLGRNSGFPDGPRIRRSRILACPTTPKGSDRNG